MNTPSHLAKSHTISIFPLILAFHKFSERGIDGFKGVTELQNTLLSYKDKAPSIRPSDEIKSMISANIVELNWFLKCNNFQIQFDERLPFSIGVVTIMDMVDKWIVKANPSAIFLGEKQYDAALIEHGASFFGHGEHAILKIRTSSDLSVFIQNDPIERSGMRLFEHVYSIANNLPQTETQCDAVIPIVTLDDQPDMRWLHGLHAKSTEFVINQVLQQNRLKITLDGIHAKSATAVGVARGISMTTMPRFMVEGPFNIWLGFERNRINTEYFPLFVAHCRPDCWKSE